jgi:hypothetical protein
MESLVLVESLATWSWFYLCIFHAYRRPATKRNFPRACSNNLLYMLEWKKERNLDAVSFVS